MTWIKYCACLAYCCMSSAHALTALSDDELRQTAGQALLNITTIGTNQAGNPNTNMGFYRLGLEATLELNLNAKSIQLGCGGSKGTGCDIDLSNVSLTGVNPVNGEYANSDAVINNPFIEFAIRNPNSSSTREIVGLRLGASSILGLLSIGTNPDDTTLADDTGINSLSGDLNVTVTNAQLTNVGVTFLGACCIIGPTTATVDTHNQRFVLNRGSSISLTGMVAEAAGLTLSNVNMNNIPLDNIHQILLAGDAAGTTAGQDAYLSLQKENVTWPTISTGTFGTTAAQTGWWISLPNVQIPDIISDQSIRISSTSAIGGLFGGAVNINAVDLQQQPVDNCFGGLSFC